MQATVPLPSHSRFRSLAIMKPDASRATGSPREMFMRTFAALTGGTEVGDLAWPSFERHSLISFSAITELLWARPHGPSTVMATTGEVLSNSSKLLRASLHRARPWHAKPR